MNIMTRACNTRILCQGAVMTYECAWSWLRMN